MKGNSSVSILSKNLIFRLLERIEPPFPNFLNERFVNLMRFPGNRTRLIKQKRLKRQLHECINSISWRFVLTSKSIHYLSPNGDTLWGLVWSILRKSYSQQAIFHRGLDVVILLSL
jgi:hypothetical protein